VRLHREPLSFVGLGAAYSLSRNYEAWLEERHSVDGDRAAPSDWNHRRGTTVVEISTTPAVVECRTCGGHCDVRWDLHADDVVFCSECLEAVPHSELGGGD
jgi:hypothetical protein